MSTPLGPALPWPCPCQIHDFAKRNRLDAQAAVKLAEVGLGGDMERFSWNISTLLSLGTGLLKPEVTKSH